MSQAKILLTWYFKQFLTNKYCVQKDLCRVYHVTIFVVTHKYVFVHTLEIYCDSGLTSLSTTVGCVVAHQYCEIVGLTQVCCAVLAHTYGHTISSAVQLIRNNVEINTINYLSRFTPLYRKTCTNSKADNCNVRGYWRG